MARGTSMRDWLNQTPAEWLDEWRTAVSDAVTGWADTMVPPATRHHETHHHRGHRAGHRCSCERSHHRCECDGCCRGACECRIVDADVVIEGLVGERRVVPLLVENTTPRTVTVTIELSSFSNGSDDVTVTGVVDGSRELSLAPCESREVLVTIEIDRPQARDDQGRPDVDECRVAYADVRVAGCGTRSTRLAVAVLPRRCVSHTVACRCRCC